MACSPAKPRYICQNCIKAISRHSKYPPYPVIRAQWRGYNSSAPARSSFRIAKHFAGDEKAPYSDQAAPPTTSASIQKLQLSTKGAVYYWRFKPRVEHSALKVDLDDGNYVPPSRSRHRIPLSTPRKKLPIRKRVLPDPPNAIQDFEIRRLETRDLPRQSASFRTPMFIHRRSFGSAVGRDDELVPSTPSLWRPAKPATHASLHFGTMEDWNWYWETLPPSISEKTQSQHFFTKSASPKFLRSVAYFRTFPESDVPEIAFVGRSNVGKSSLLNAIVNADVKALLARTSATPGFTKTMNLYGVGPNNGVNFKKQPSGHDKLIGKGGLTIVDMPGYGEGSLQEWGVEIMKYLQNRKQLRRVFVLLDAKHGIKDKDRSLLSSLRLGGIEHQVILSKLDKLYIPDAKEVKRFDGKRLDKLKPKGSIKDLKKTMDKIRMEIQPRVGGGALGEILCCSAEVLVDGRRLGIDAVRFAMLQAIGFPFKSHGHVKEAVKIPVRTMKTNRVEPGPPVRTMKSDRMDQMERAARDGGATRTAGRVRGRVRGRGRG